MKRNMYLTLFILFFLFILVKHYRADAIPSFSRKHKTSCTTCHYAFPKLNAFGEAFRRNGYQFPGGQEETMVKEKPVSLGAGAYKRVWPGAIWPGSIPGTAPLAIILENEIVYAPKAPKGEPTLNFEHLMGEMEVLAGGTISENISFLGAVEISQEGVEIEMGQMAFNNLLKLNLLNIEVGQIPPEVLFITNHRRLGPQYWITTRTVGDNQWSLEGSQKGIEAYGILKNGRVLYNLGLVEGRGNMLNSAKDVYAHLAIKLGGLRYDGITEENALVGPTESWVDNSLQVGGFIYLCEADLSVPGGYNQRDSFKMLGADFNFFFYEDLNLLGDFSWQRDNKPFVTNSTQSAEVTNLFLEANYVIYPWLIPTLRYERFELEDETDSRLVPTIQALMRANLRGFIALEFEKETIGDFILGNVEFGFVIGF